MLGGYCRGQPWGPLKQPGESCFKPAKNQKQHISHLSTRPRHGPHHGGPHGPTEWPSQGLPRAGPASLEGLHLPRTGSASLEGSRLPRVASASLEDPSPPRSRIRLRPARGLPRTHARPRTRVRAFNALTRRGSAIMRLGITPWCSRTNSLGEPIPATAGNCAAWPVSVP
jgi:hypothetical protein